MFIVLENCFSINFSKILDKMVVSCCAVDCSNRFKLKEKGVVVFFHFSNEKKDPRKQRWIEAMRRVFWTYPYIRVCGDFFVKGNNVSFLNHIQHTFYCWIFCMQTLMCIYFFVNNKCFIVKKFSEHVEHMHLFFSLFILLIKNT